MQRNQNLGKTSIISVLKSVYGSKMIPLVGISGDACPAFQNQDWIPHLYVLSPVHDNIPPIHLWCNTSLPLDGQHCCQVFSINILFEHWSDSNLG